MERVTDTSLMLANGKQLKNLTLGCIWDISLSFQLAFLTGNREPHTSVEMYEIVETAQAGNGKQFEDMVLHHC